MNLETFAANHGVKLNKLYTSRGFNSCIRQASVANDAWIEWEDFFARWSGKDKVLSIELQKPNQKDLILELRNRMAGFGFKCFIDSDGSLEVWGMGFYEEFNTERKIHPFQWLLLELEWIEEDYKVTKFDENGCPVLSLTIPLLRGKLLFGLIFARDHTLKIMAWILIHQSFGMILA